MRSLFLLSAFLLSALFASAANPTVVYNTRYFTGVSMSNIVLELKPISLSSQSNALILPVPRPATTDVSGIAIFTNVFPTSYQVTFHAENDDLVYTNCIDDLAGTLYVTITNFCGARPTNGVGWSIAQSDLRYPSVAGTNISFTTNAQGRVVVNITGAGDVTSAQLNAVSSALTNLAYVIGANDTNFSLAIGQAVSNLVYTIGLNGTNYANGIAVALSNLNYATGLNGTNYTDSRAVALSNLSYVIGANGTNFTYTIGANGTNYANAVGLVLTNLIVSLTTRVSNIESITNLIGTGSGGGSSVNYLSQDAGTTNSLIQDVSSVWWRQAHTNIGLAMTPVYLADAPVLKTNGFYTLNTSQTATNGGYQFKVYPVQAPAGATTLKFALDAIAITSATNAMMIGIINSNYASEVALLTNQLVTTAWSNVVLSASVTAGNVYYLAIYTAYPLRLTNASFAVRNLNATWNSTGSSNAVDAFHSINNEPVLLPWYGSRVSFTTTSSVVAVDVWSDLTNAPFKLLTVETNGQLYGNIFVTNYGGVYSINFGSAQRREITIYNGPQQDTSYGGTNRYGTWVRRVFVSEPALTFDRVSQPDILVLGDSISAGYSCTNYTVNWQGQLERSLGQKIANRSWGAARISDYNTNLANPWMIHIANVNPRTVLIPLGYNSLQGGNIFPYPDHARGVSNLAYSARYAFPDKRFIWFTPWGTAPSVLSTTISNMTASSGVAVYPGENLLPDSTYKADGIHPNEKGAAQVASVISDLVRTNYAGPIGASTLEYTGTNYARNYATDLVSIVLGPVFPTVAKPRAFGQGGTAIGDGVTAGFRGVGIGFQATNGGNTSVAIGHQVYNDNNNSVGIGAGVYNLNGGNGIGESLHTSGQYSFSMGRLSTNTATGGTFLFGNQSRLGAGSAFSSIGTYLLGFGSIIAGNSEGLNLLLGNGSVMTNTANGNGVSEAISIGSTNRITVSNAVVIGSKGTNNTYGSILLSMNGQTLMHLATNWIVARTNTVSTPPPVAVLGMGGWALWNSNGSPWVSRCTDGSTVESKSLF